MRVNTIGARIKATKEVNGCWKTIEFGAEGILESGDDWKKSQDQLFADLTSQLKKAFNPNGKNPKKPDYPERPIPKGTNTGKGKPKSKPCPVHPGQMLKLWSNENGGQWYSHLVEDEGEPYWCSGKPKKKGNKKK